MLNGAGVGGKGKKGWVELQDSGGGEERLPQQQEQELPPALSASADDHLGHLEEVSLGGGSSAWLAARRGSSDDDMTAPASSTADFDSVHPDPSSTGSSSNNKMGPALARLLDPATAHGLAWLALALLLASMNPSVLARLMYRSAAKQELVYTPVSILGAASLLGFLVAVRVFWTDIRKVNTLSRAEWAFLVLTAMSGPCLASFYLVDGLRLTSVPIAAVIGRLDAAFLLVFATVVGVLPSRPPSTSTTNNTKTRLLWSAANALLLALAALLAAVTRDPRLPVEHGDYAALPPNGGSSSSSARMPSPKGTAFLCLGALLTSITQLSTRVALQRVPLGLLTTTRLFIAYLLFHPLALAYGGRPALLAMYHPKLWLTMLWYCPLFVWLLQYAWLRALRSCPPSFIASALAASLLLELLWARLIVQQSLTFGESIAAGIVLIAMLSALTERWYRGTAQAWTEEDEGVPPAITPASATATKPAVGDEEEAKEAPCNPPSHGVAPPVAVGSSSLARRPRTCIDTAGVAPGREATLRHHYV